jgi:hypothetical protein
MMTATREKRRCVRLTDPILARLQIPSNKKEQFQLSIESLVANTFRQKEDQLRAGQIARPLKRISDLSNRLAKALTAATEGQDKVARAVKGRLEYELRHTAEQPPKAIHPEKVDLVALHAELAKFLCGACKKAAARVNINHEARGGRAGIKGHSGLLPFIQQLVTRILRVGGKFPPEKNAGTEVIIVLDVLRRNLPPSFLPEQHPVAAYNHCIQKAAEEYDRLRAISTPSQ